MLTRHRALQGLTLIELLIGMAIVGILVLQSFPFINVWVQNTRIRTGAESILNGLQLARAQAVRSNFNTEFVLIPTGTNPTPANIAAVADGNGNNWIVRSHRPDGVPDGGYNPINPTTLIPHCPPADPDCDFTQGHAAGGVISAPIGSGRSAGGPFVAGSFVFTPLGRLLNPPANQVIPITIDSANNYTDKRIMCIVVSPGGQVVMCDPGGDATVSPQFCSHPHPVGACQ